jgi:hypothetical protein
MPQKNRITHIIVATLVVVTLLHVGYRLFRGDQGVSRHVYSGSRGERLETWNNMRRLKLTDENISAFVDAMLSNPTLPAPKGTSEISFASLTELQKADIREALIGFFAAYRGDDPNVVYDYLAISRGSTQLDPGIKKSIQDVARQSGNASTLETDKDVFGHIWDLGSKGIAWEFLLDKSGQSSFWQTGIPLTPNQSIQMVLEDPALFSNITTAGHIFTVSLKKDESLKRGEEMLFCDSFFVTELSKVKDQDFCALGVRFWYDKIGKKWIPDVLVLVTPVVRQDIKVPF